MPPSLKTREGRTAVNDRRTDQQFSGFEGITQSETSTALCVNPAAVGFNDSGSELQSLFFGTAGSAFRAQRYLATGEKPSRISDW